MKNFLLALSLLSCFCCKENGVKLEHPTTFVHYYNGGTPDVAQTIIKTSDGGYLIMANTQTKITSSYYRIKLIKVDAFGNEIWNRQIPKVLKKSTDPSAPPPPPAPSYRGFGVTAITDNSGSDTGYFIVGEEIYNDPSNNGNRTQGLLMIQIHVDPTKGVVGIDSVTKTVADINASVRGVGVAKAKNGNFYVLGKQFPPANNPNDPNDMFLTEIDANNFSPVWTRSYGAASTTVVNNVFTYGDSIYWGGTRTAVATQEMILISAQVNTTAQIANTFPEGQAFTSGTPSVPINYSCSDICKYGFGYGLVGSYSISPGVYNRIAFFRVDENGKATDSVSYKMDNPLGPPFQGAGNSICSTQDGGFLVLGTAAVDASNSDTNYILIKTDGHGAMQWTKQYGGRFVDVGTKVLQANDGGFIVLGTTNLGNVESIFLMKTDSEGNIQ